LHLDPADKSYMLAENTMLKQRVHEMMDDAIHRARADAAGVDAGKLVDERIAELEAEVNGLYVDLGAAQDAAHNQQLILGEQMTALAVERRAVEKLATKLGADCTCPDTMVCMERIDECMDTSSDKECTACWAAWARKQAREEGGE